MPSPRYSGYYLSVSPRVTDAIIAILLLVFALGAAMTGYWLWIHPQDDASRQTIAAALFGVSLAGFLTLLYSAFVEPRLLTVRRKRLHTALPEGLHIAVIADLHVGPFKKAGFVRRVVDRTNALKADIILLAGDFLFDSDAPISELRPLKDLHAPLGVFGVTGNHDSGKHLTLLHHPFSTRDCTDELCTFLQSCGVTMLRNTTKKIETNTGRFYLSGVDDLWSDTSDLGAALHNVPVHAPVLLLSHHPDTVLDKRSHRADLVVTGHTHGGQMRLPFVGTLSPVPSILGRKYAWGDFRFGKKTMLVVSCGAGETLARTRLFCRPEVLLIETV